MLEAKLGVLHRRERRGPGQPTQPPARVRLGPQQVSEHLSAGPVPPYTGGAVFRELLLPGGGWRLIRKRNDCCPLHGRTGCHLTELPLAIR
jgi:hypothetical protein